MTRAAAKVERDVCGVPTAIIEDFGFRVDLRSKVLVGSRIPQIISTCIPGIQKAKEVNLEPR